MTRFCSISCNNTAAKENKKIEKERVEKLTLLKNFAIKIAEVQSRELFQCLRQLLCLGFLKIPFTDI